MDEGASMASLEGGGLKSSRVTRGAALGCGDDRAWVSSVYVFDCVVVEDVMKGGGG